MRSSGKCARLTGSRMTGGKGAGRRRAWSEAGSVWTLNSATGVHWGIPEANRSTRRWSKVSNPSAAQRVQCNLYPTASDPQPRFLPSIIP